MARSIKFDGVITWEWVRAGYKTPKPYPGDIKSAWLHPDGAFLINFECPEDWQSTWQGSVRLQRVGETEQFTGQGTARHENRVSEIAAVRCTLQRVSDSEWLVKDGYWRETLDKGSYKENTKEAEWWASMVLRDEVEWEQPDGNSG